jgi:hypothetical protein
VIFAVRVLSGPIANRCSGRIHHGQIVHVNPPDKDRSRGVGAAARNLSTTELRTEKRQHIRNQLLVEGAAVEARRILADLWPGRGQCGRTGSEKGKMSRVRDQMILALGKERRRAGGSTRRHSSLAYGSGIITKPVPILRDGGQGNVSRGTPGGTTNSTDAMTLDVVWRLEPPRASGPPAGPGWQGSLVRDRDMRKLAVFHWPEIRPLLLPIATPPSFSLPRHRTATPQQPRFCSGSPGISSLRMSHLRGAAGYVLVADGTRPATLDVALSLRRRVETEFGPLPFVLLLNKNDLREGRAICDAEIEDLRQSGWWVQSTLWPNPISSRRQASGPMKNTARSHS